MQTSATRSVKPFPTIRQPAGSTSWPIKSHRMRRKYSWRGVKTGTSAIRDHPDEAAA